MSAMSGNAPKKPARKVRLTRAVIDTLVKAAEVGMTGDGAAEIVGCSPRSVRRWRARARRGERGLVGELHSRLIAAEKQWSHHHMGIIAAAAQGEETVVKTTKFPDGSVKTETTTKCYRDWRASAWLLAHAWPEVFGSDSLDLSEIDKVITHLRKQLNQWEQKPPLEELLGRLQPATRKVVKDALAEESRQHHDARWNAYLEAIPDATVRAEFAGYLAMRGYRKETPEAPPTLDAESQRTKAEMYARLARGEENSLSPSGHRGSNSTDSSPHPVSPDEDAGLGPLFGSEDV